jgi:hypothetical protein
MCRKRRDEGQEERGEKEVYFLLHVDEEVWENP